MAGNPRPQAINSRWDEAFDESVSELAAFSTEQLAAMNKVLIALLHAASLPELLDIIFRSLSTVARMSACAHYVVADDGHLYLHCGAGEFSDSLPAKVSSDSQVYESVRNSSHARPIVSKPLQPSLFGDTPSIAFWAVEHEGRFAGAFACVYASEAEEFVDAVCRQVAVTVDAYYQPEAKNGSEGIAQVISVEPVTSAVGRLTDREQEVLTLLCRGLGNKEISSRLFISNATCKRHVENILLKLGVHNRAAAVAVGLGLVQRPDQDSPLH